MVNPFHGLYAGVTRMTRAGEPEGGWYANQKVTREEALRAFTIWAAYGHSLRRDLKGSLEPGKLADFVVIDRDYMTCPEGGDQGYSGPDDSLRRRGGLYQGHQRAYASLAGEAGYPPVWGAD